MHADELVLPRQLRELLGEEPGPDIALMHQQDHGPLPATYCFHVAVGQVQEHALDLGREFAKNLRVAVGVRARGVPACGYASGSSSGGAHAARPQPCGLAPVVKLVMEVPSAPLAALLSES